MVWHLLLLLPKSLYSHDLITNKRSPLKSWAMVLLMVIPESNRRIYLYTDGGKDLCGYFFGLYFCNHGLGR